MAMISGSIKNIKIIGDVVIILLSNLLIDENVNLELATINFGCSDSYSENISQITGAIVSVPNRIIINDCQIGNFLDKDNLLLELI